MAPKSVTFRRLDHLVSVLFGDLLSHSYNITFSMFLDLVTYRFQHPNLVGLMGYCVDPPALVYPFMEGGSLYEHFTVTRFDTNVCWFFIKATNCRS